MFQFKSDVVICNRQGRISLYDLVTEKTNHTRKQERKRLGFNGPLYSMLPPMI